MAIAFARVSIHTRSKGHSAIAAISYRAGIKLVDERTGLTHDFSRRDDVIFSELLLPEGTDSAFSNRDFLWNSVEAFEKRIDAQLCKDVVLALPKEISREQQIELAKKFANNHFVSNGLPADIAIHDHGDGNPHAHILIPTRRLKGKQFSKYKARDLNPAFAKGFVVENDFWGEQWRNFQNEFFKEKNLNMQVDANHLIAERHQGKYRNSNDHYLKQENDLIKEARMEATRENINLVLEHLSYQYSVFTRRDVERFLFKTFATSDNPQEYLQFVEQVLNHKDVIELGENQQNRTCFTTRQQYEAEIKLLRNIESLMQSKKHQASGSVDKLAKQFNLSEEQRAAFTHITETPDISVVIGRPGTGKSYLLKPVKAHYEQAGYQVIGASLSGKVAKALDNETGIQSSTIKSLAYRLENNLIELTDKHVLFVDEAGMVDFDSMAYLTDKVRKSGAKLVLIGDPDQLKPIQKGEIFRSITSHTGYIELENIKRQQDLGDRQASLEMAKGNIDKGIQHYHDKGALIFADNQADASVAVINSWQKGLEHSNLEDNVMLSFTRKAVNELNDKARDTLLAHDKLGNENIIFQGTERKLQISSGERILFRENNKALGVRNGDTATVKQVTKKAITAKLDSGEQISIPKEYHALDYSYALTVHKSQGMTAKNVNVLIDSPYWDRNLSFVAMTRHKQHLKIYADKENHPTKEELAHMLSRTTVKKNVMDWGLSSSKQRLKPTDSLKKEMPQLVELEKLLNKRGRMTGYFAERADKKISSLSNELFSNEVMAYKIKLLIPKLYKELQSYRNKMKEFLREK